MTHFIRALALFVLSALPIAAQENTKLDELSRRGELLGWEAVGRVDLGGAYCTGVLIAPDLVLTAAHCLFDEGGAKRNHRNFVFSAGLRNGKYVGQSGVLRAAAHGEYRPTERTSTHNIRYDVALLELSRSIPAATAAPFAVHTGADRTGRVSVVSYGKGRDDAPSWQRSCGLLDRRDGLMAFDCDVTFGSSGAPIFMQHGNRVRILSLVSAGVFDGDKPISYGMELAALIPAVKSRLRAAPGGGLTGSLNGGARRIRVGGGARNDTGARFVRPGS